MRNVFRYPFFLHSAFRLPRSAFETVGREALESSSAVLQTAATPSQLPTRKRIRSANCEMRNYACTPELATLNSHLSTLNSSLPTKKGPVSCDAGPCAVPIEWTAGVNRAGNNLGDPGPRFASRQTGRPRDPWLFQTVSGWPKAATWLKVLNPSRAYDFPDHATPPVHTLLDARRGGRFARNFATVSLVAANPATRPALAAPLAGRGDDG